MSSSVASSSASVHQRQAAIPSETCIAATSPSARPASSTRPTKNRSCCRTIASAYSMTSVRSCTSGPSGTSFQPVSSNSSRRAPAR